MKKPFGGKIAVTLGTETILRKNRSNVWKESSGNFWAVGDQCGNVGNGVPLQKNHGQIWAVSDLYGNIWNGRNLEENSG